MRLRLLLRELVCGCAVLTLLIVLSLSVLLLSGDEGTHHLQRQQSPLNRSEERKLGYFLALKYYEQQTQATKNFLQMQCLASSYGMQVVEPFLQHSQLGFPFSTLLLAHLQGDGDGEGSQDQVFRFGDIMDLNLWNKQTGEMYGYPAVASWKQFLDSAPRNLVIVCVRYRDPPVIRVPTPGYNYRTGCGQACFVNFAATVNFLKHHNFVLVRKVCANFVSYAGSVTSEDFLDNILGERYNASNVTVILNQFRGFFGLYRIQVLSPCGLLSHANIKVSVLPSAQLVNEAKKYSTMNFGNRSYISVMVRAEKVVLHSHHNMSHCTRLAKSIIWKLRKQYMVNDFLLTMDIGRFGSNGAQMNQKVQEEGSKFFESMYEGTWSIADWEKSFLRASSSYNPAYIANLQRTVAARGVCLVMVGAGGFQAQARSLYERYHPNITTQCIHKICAD